MGLNTEIDRQLGLLQMSTPTVVSANRLTDGTVAYLDADGNWVASLAEARILTTKDEEAAALAKAESAVRDNLVLDPLVVEIAQTPRGWQAKSLRNTIRAAGPTVKYATAPEAARS
jgi:Protein of unknown function (DUF2849)